MGARRGPDLQNIIGKETACGDNEMGERELNQELGLETRPSQDGKKKGGGGGGGGGAP